MKALDQTEVNSRIQIGWSSGLWHETRKRLKVRQIFHTALPPFTLHCNGAVAVWLLEQTKSLANLISGRRDTDKCFAFVGTTVG